jgi:very-short-patch-repair endonuclease
MVSKLEKLIEKSNIKHNNKYDYSKCNQIIYKKIKNEIICHEHGSFFKSWDYHINSISGGCSFCMNKRPRRTREQWLDYLNNIHNNKYDYSKVDFKLGVMVKQDIICPEHGDFKVTIDNHSTKKSGCPKCIGRYRTREEWVVLFDKLYNNKYNYSQIPKNFGVNDKIKIICPEHGEFEKLVSNHIYLGKQGCPVCGKEIGYKKHTHNILDVIVKARKIHFDDYEYNISGYVNTLSKIEIICHKHGSFSQKISNHLQGQGCPICNKSKGELKIRKWLIENQIEYLQQKKMDGCINPITGYSLFFDFYLPLHNICVEFDGEQHFKSTKRFGGYDAFEKTKSSDKIKNEFCKEKGIELIRIPYNQIKEIDNILYGRLC